MKESLDHLPEKKQRQLRALTELICKEAGPEMVILFGSFARGDWVEDPKALQRAGCTEDAAESRLHRRRCREPAAPKTPQIAG